MSRVRGEDRRRATGRDLAAAARRALDGLIQLGPAHPDADLLKACAAWLAIHHSIQASRAATTAEADAEASWRSASKILRRMAAARATTPEGHAARAAAFVLWDDGDLIGRARNARILEELMLAAIVTDLVDPGDATP